MSLEIVKVSTPADLNRFVSLPWKVYAHSPLWVPNLKSDDRTLLTPGKHPFWETAHRELFLALRDGEAVGRIAAIVDEKYNEFARSVVPSAFSSACLIPKLLPPSSGPRTAG